MATPELMIRRFKGLRVNSTRSEKAQEELSRADNVYFDREQILSARPGIRKVLSDNVAIGTLTPANIVSIFINSSTGDRKLVSNVDTRIFFSDGVGNFVATVPSMTTPAQQAVFYDGKVYFSNGRYWDGAVLAVSTGSPVDYSRIRLHKDRIWITDNSYTLTTTRGYRVYFSKPGASVTTGWSASDFIDVKSGGTIKSIESYRDSLYVLKSDSTWIIATGGLPENWTLRKLSDSGCLGGSCVYDEVLYWIGPTGFFAYNGVQVARLSDAVQEFFDINEFVFDERTQVVGFEGNLYVTFWTSTGGVTTKHMFIYNPGLKAWTKVLMDQNMFNNLGRAFVIEGKLGVDPTKDLIPSGIWFGDNPIVGDERGIHSYYRMNLDDNSFLDKNHDSEELEYTVTVETSAMDFDKPTDKKRLKYGVVEMQGSRITVTQSDDEGRVRVTELSGNDPTKVSYRRFPGLGFFRKMYFTFTSSEFPEGLKFFSLMGHLDNRGKESNNSQGTYG